MKPIAKIFLGGIEDGEYGDIDIETSHRELEAMQERLVTSGDDVWVPLYALDVEALRSELLDVMRFESHRMGAVSAGILRRAIARMDDATPNAELCGSPKRSAGESERAPGYAAGAKKKGQ